MTETSWDAEIFGRLLCKLEYHRFRLLLLLTCTYYLDLQSLYEFLLQREIDGFALQLVFASANYFFIQRQYFAPVTIGSLVPTDLSHGWLRNYKAVTFLASTCMQPLSRIMSQDSSTAKSVHRGACFCKAITYQVIGPPILSAYCHCTLCQRFTGKNYPGLPTNH